MIDFSQNCSLIGITTSIYLKKHKKATSWEAAFLMQNTEGVMQ